MSSGLVHSCTLSKRNRKKKFSYTGGSGTPSVGQTVTGQTSAKTAVVDKVGSGYLVVRTLSGTFTTTETITTLTFSGTLSAQADYQNQSGEYEYYWTNDQTSVPCRFYYMTRTSGGGVIVHETGQLIEQPLKVALPSSCTVDEDDYRVVSTETGFSGTYDISSLFPLTGLSGIHHYEAVLRKVTS